MHYCVSVGMCISCSGYRGGDNDGVPSSISLRICFVYFALKPLEKAWINHPSDIKVGLVFLPLVVTSL